MAATASAGTKVDLKRELKPLYAPPATPVLVDVPERPYVMVDGRGDPNTSPAYGEAVAALYTVAYALKFALKRGLGGVDYAVMPLERLWWVPDMSTFSVDDKASWDWTMMIMQPEVVTPEMVADAIASAAKKKPLPAAARLRPERFGEGRAAQVMHLGPYVAEGPTIARLHASIADQGFQFTGKHHEIYLSDPKRTAPERLKTILRQPVAPAQSA